MSPYATLVYDIEYVSHAHILVLLSFDVFVFSLFWIHMIYLPIFFSVTSLALGQSYDCPSASEVTLKDMGKINLYHIANHKRGT